MKKGTKLTNYHDRRVAELLEDRPSPYNRETMLELLDHETGEVIPIRAFDLYAAGWAEPIPCYKCKGWAPFSNLCEPCQAKQDQETLERCRAAIKDPKFSHARARRWCRQWSMQIYHRDPSSPSGVMLAASGPEEVVEPLLKEHRRAGALSPTEGLRRG